MSPRAKDERVSKLKELDKRKREGFYKESLGKELRATVVEVGKLLTENYLQLEVEGFTEIGKVVRIRL